MDRRPYQNPARSRHQQRLHVPPIPYATSGIEWQLVFGLELLNQRSGRGSGLRAHVCQVDHDETGDSDGYNTIDQLLGRDSLEARSGVEVVDGRPW